LREPFCWKLKLGGWLWTPIVLRTASRVAKAIVAYLHA
jgi:hypothetical protein